VGSPTDDYWLVLAQSLRVSHLQTVWFLFVLGPSISLACQDLPSSSLSNAVDCPLPHHPHHISLFSFVCVLFAIKPTNHSQLWCLAPSLTAASPHSARYVCIVPLQLLYSKADEGMGRVRGRASYFNKWCEDVTNNVVGHNISLFVGVVPSLPVPSLLASFFPSSRAPQDSIPLHSYLILRFLCPFCPLV